MLFFFFILFSQTFKPYRSFALIMLTYIAKVYTLFVFVCMVDVIKVYLSITNPISIRSRSRIARQSSKNWSRSVVAVTSPLCHFNLSLPGLFLFLSPHCFFFSEFNVFFSPSNVWWHRLGQWIHRRNEYKNNENKITNNYLLIILLLFFWVVLRTFQFQIIFIRCSFF